MKRYLSICSGIEAATVAWHGLGWQPAGFSEVEAFPSAVLAHHYPSVPNFGDMRTFKEWNIGAIDILVGGTPCQAFSVAGLRRGLADERGNLSLTFCELADHVDPEWIVWENVPGVLSSRDNAFGCFLAGLVGADEPIVPGGKWERQGVVSGPKRTAAWRVLDAQYFGVAQRRRRVFVLAVRGSGNWRCAAALFPVGESVFGDSPPSRETRADFTHDLAPCLTSSGRGVERTGDTRGQDPVFAVGSVVASNAEGAEGLPCLTASNIGKQHNNQMPIVAFDPTQVTHPENRSNPQPGDPCHTLPRTGYAPAVAFQTRGSNLYVGDISGTIGTNADRASGSAPCIAFNARQDPDHWIERTGPLDTHGSTQAIAFQSSPQAVTVAHRDVMPTMVSGGSTDASHNQMSGQFREEYIVPQGMAVRRLTPVECERLQGFPDGYTQIPTWNGWRKMDASETPESCRAEGLEIKQNKKTGKWRVKDVDGPRYKALGNSMAVPVMRWIGKRIAFVSRHY